jgi:dTDP-4-amino-4,6-dideoxygalactose transaminase
MAMGTVAPHQRLEIALAELLDTNPDQMVACSSGTAALHLALEALRLDNGRSIALPDYTMIACPRAATMVGLSTRLVDCYPNLLMKAETYPSCQFIMPVHIYGRRCNVERMHTLNPNSLIVEDMAELHGVRPSVVTDAACWSFYKNKVIAGEEGGACYFRDVGAAERARELRCLGFTPAHDFKHRPRGHNYRLADCLASLILESLRQYPDNYSKRRKVEHYYDQAIPQEWKMPGRSSPWVYDLRIPGLTRKLQYKIVGALNEQGIAARCGFCPIALQREYMRDYSQVSPNAFTAFHEVFYLPIYPTVNESWINDVVSRLVTAHASVAPPPSFGPQNTI